MINRVSGKITSKGIRDRKKLEKRLKDYGVFVRGMEPMKRDSQIRAIMQKQTPDSLGGSRWDFIRFQIGFMEKYCLIPQCIWFILFYVCMKEESIRYLCGRAEVMLSVLPPVLVMLTIEEVSRFYHKSMLEIEYTTKYSLTHIIMTRMLFFSILNAIIILGGILLVRTDLEAELLQIIVYGFTPMILASAALLYGMQFVSGDYLRVLGAAVYIFVVLFCFFGGVNSNNIYHENFFYLWECAFGIGSVFCIYEFVKLAGKLNKYEQVADL